ncbi:carbon monoxide dehydrogenase [Amycolatopsis sp. A1MSW2902]|uniref:xanthine dehydrogenase family protein molybdopterin-binding subunit n=1 Tax=Amycolatopsis sp. A1MSW2902 TaxID=687413 RepID=UPI00307DBCF9
MTGHIGARMARVQDDRLLAGDGHYVDDLDETGVLHAALVRSPIAMGELTRFDATEARAVDGVVLVLGPDEIAPLVDEVPLSWLLYGQQIPGWQVVGTTVRFVGQPLGVVLAASRAAAEDAAELVEMDFEEKPAVVGIAGARAADATLLYPETGSNQIGSFHFGTAVEELEEVFANAAHVVERDLVVPRISHSPMEPRGLVAEYTKATGELLVVSSTQVPHLVRQELAQALRLRQDQVRVVAPDVGGSFGQKASLAPDEAMVCLAAKLLGRKVKWIEDRTEALVAAYQGRGTFSRSRLALDADGRFLAIHADLHGDAGAFCSSGTGGTGPFQVAALMIEGPYRYDKAGATVTGWYTNATPTAAFRGYGMQEGTWIRERLVDEAARVLGIDPITLRHRNMLPSDALPHLTHTGVPFDNGDYPDVLARAAAIAEQKRKPSTDRVRRGIGLASMVEITAFAPSALLEMFHIHWSGYETSTIRVNEDGTVTVFSGVTNVGQGIDTALTQVAAERLGVPCDWIRVRLGDTAVTPYSNIGSQASRALALAGGALWNAADKLAHRMRALAAGYLDAAPEQVRLDGDTFRAEGGASMPWREVAHRGWLGWGRGEATAIRLEETVEFDPASITFGYATHGAQVAVDLDTGQTKVEDYWIVHDSGVIVNPAVAEGQMLGGFAMGLGSALHEQVTYDPNGQPTATTYLDYLVPLSEDVPDVVLEHVETPSGLIPGGFKGLGESGTIPPPAAIGNAVAAAVPEIAERITTTPLHPSRVWSWLDDAKLTR